MWSGIFRFFHFFLKFCNFAGVCLFFFFFNFILNSRSVPIPVYNRAAFQNRSCQNATRHGEDTTIWPARRQNTSRLTYAPSFFFKLNSALPASPPSAHFFATFGKTVVFQQAIPPRPHGAIGNSLCGARAEACIPLRNDTRRRTKLGS